MTSLVFLGPSSMFMTTLMTKVRRSTSCLPMCLTAMLHSRLCPKRPLLGSLRPPAKRWTDVIGSSDSITATHQLKHGTSSRSRGIWLFGFKAKLKWSIFINYYARSHILLTSGTPSSLLPLPQLRLKLGHPLTQILLAVLLSPIHCVLLSTPPLLVLFSRPLGSVPLSSLFTKVDTMPHPRTTIPSLFSQFLVMFLRSTIISSFHNIFTPTTCSILFSLDSALPTQTKLFFSTALTNGIRPLTPRSMWVQCSSTFPRPSTLSDTSYFYPNSPT